MACMYSHAMQKQKSCIITLHNEVTVPNSNEVTLMKDPLPSYSGLDMAQFFKVSKNNIFSTMYRKPDKTIRRNFACIQFAFSVIPCQDGESQNGERFF
jgi:hypothetical protein